MDNDQFTELFKYMQAELGNIRDEIASVDAKVDRVYKLLDQDLKQRETDEEERLVISHQLDRQRGWIAQLAKHTKTKLVPEP